jgi:hypothetical protein
MAHIKRKHARNEFLRRQKEEKNQKSRDLRLGLEYSKNNEFEADADGLNYMMAAGYASQEAVAALERLQAADSIYPEPALDFTSMMGKIPSDTSTDQHSNRNSGTTVVIVGQAAETKSSGTGSRDESDDTYSTHPYSSRRVEALKVLIRETERSTGKNTGTKGSGQYDAIHQAAMMESLWQQMQQGDYLEAFYKAAKEQQNAANPFQAAIMGQCLHWMATVKEADNFSVPDEGDVRGVGSSFLTFARQLEGIGPNALREWGYKYLDKLPEAYEDDEEFAFAKAMLTEAFTGTQTGKIVYRRFLDRFPQSDYAPFCQSKL